MRMTRAGAGEALHALGRGERGKGFAGVGVARRGDGLDARGAGHVRAGERRPADVDPDVPEDFGGVPLSEEKTK